MVLRILFPQNWKKYPQNTFRVHKRKFSNLCTLMVTLFSFCLTGSQLLQPAAAAEKLNI